MKIILKEFKSIFKIVTENWVTLLYFEIIYKTFGFTVLFPFIKYLLSLLPNLAGVDYISQENIGKLFNKPLAILLIICILILLALYIIYEIIAFMLLCEKSWHHEKIKLLYLSKITFTHTLSLLKPNKIAVFSLFPALILSGFSLISGYLNTIRIPEFILEFIKGNKLLYSIYILVLLFFNILLLFYIFGFPILFFSKKSFRESWHESLKLLQKKKLRILVKIFILLLLFVLSFIILSFFIPILLGVYTKFFSMERETFQFYILTWLSVAEIVGGALISTFLCGIIIFYYHKYQGEIWNESKLAHKKTNKRQIFFQTGSIIILMLLLILFSETEIGGNIFLPINPNPIVVAHRAGATFAPENTFKALENAIANGADAVEIDVQQLSDGTLIVVHDTNFKRTTGTNLNVWDAEYEMVQNLDAGWYFYNEEHPKEPIPTLEEFIQKADKKINLMIELKAAGHEKKLEESVIELIDKYKIKNQCSIASMNLDILKRIKELDPNIETIYITALLISNQYDLNFVDGYSVETTSLSSEMAVQIQFQGKKIYAWTANSNYSINKILKCNVDGLITDNPLLAQYAIEEYGKNLLIDEFIKLFY